jgi:hypothetical protein
MVSLALTVALGVAAALALTRPWEGGRPATNDAVVATDAGVSIAELALLELAQHEALTEAVFGPASWEPHSAQSIADALAQHEALTDAVFGSVRPDAPAPPDLSAYPYLAEFVAKYHPWTDGWLAPAN